MKHCGIHKMPPKTAGCPFDEKNNTKHCLIKIKTPKEI
jgi:hypothetical protein